MLPGVNFCEQVISEISIQKCDFVSGHRNNYDFIKLRLYATAQHFRQTVLRLLLPMGRSLKMTEPLASTLSNKHPSSLGKYVGSHQQLPVRH